MKMTIDDNEAREGIGMGLHENVESANSRQT